MTSKLDRVDGPSRVGRVPALAGRATGACCFVDPRTGRPAEGSIADGILQVTGFRVDDGVLQVVGVLAGTCSSEGTTCPAFRVPVAAPVDVAVTRAPDACRTLRLRIPPVQVGTRRLAVHTTGTVVGLTASTGPGHLLGNLLVAIVNARSRNASTAHVAELLNHVVTLAG